MSWQLASLAGLAAVIIAGFAWYERSRPSARLLALVAALAALAVAGRVALAPIPNVVATTDVVLLAGYALGAGPGFVVGALAALVSNLWLGQGPWTIWQMVGWGLVGVGGATLARALGRELGRWALAAAAAFAGLAYGALLDLHLMVSFGGEQSLDRYLALSARSVPFNLAHAVGNAALMLAAGPVLVRMLVRFRRRSAFRWADAPLAAGRAATLTLVLALLGFGALAGLAPERSEAGLGEARQWLVAQQNRDGGFGASPGDGSSVEMTGWVALGLEAAGVNPLDVTRARRDPITYLERHARELRSIGDLERTVLALAGAGVDPRSFAGRDLVAELRRGRRGDGSWEGQVNLTSYGVLAMRAAGVGGGELDRSARWLRDARNRDGGWGFAPGTDSEADSTGAALEALAAAGSGSTSEGVGYLRRAQRRGGGWALTSSSPSNAQSTALALRGLIAAGAGAGSVRSGGASGLDFLGARQQPGGSYRYSAGTDRTPVWVTAQAMIAVAGEALPIAAVERRPAGDRSGGSPGDGGSAGSAEAERRGRAADPAKRRRGGRSNRGAGDPERSERAGEEAGAAPGEISGRAAAALRDDDDATAVIVLAGLGLLAAALLGGFWWYRRRLPEP